MNIKKTIALGTLFSILSPITSGQDNKSERKSDGTVHESRYSGPANPLYDKTIMYTCLLDKEDAKQTQTHMATFVDFPDDVAKVYGDKAKDTLRFIYAYSGQVLESERDDLFLQGHGMNKTVVIQAMEKYCKTGSVADAKTQKEMLPDSTPDIL